MKQPIDLTGQRFGRLTVVEEAPKSSHGNRRWRCECDCGTICFVETGDLTGLRQKSCGCFKKERTAISHKTHGQRRTRLYTIWFHMKTRCESPNDKNYSDYGGRGISVCSEWKNSFLAFYQWAMASGYSHDLTIDRRDNNGNYCPENCRWITIGQQQNNRRSNHQMTAFGRTQNIKQWADEFGVPYHTLLYRVAHGWTPERALTTPPKGLVPKSDTNN